MTAELEQFAKSYSSQGHRVETSMSFVNDLWTVAVSAVPPAASAPVRHTSSDRSLDRAVYATLAKFVSSPTSV